MWSLAECSDEHVALAWRFRALSILISTGFYEVLATTAVNIFTEKAIILTAKVFKTKVNLYEVSN